MSRQSSAFCEAAGLETTPAGVMASAEFLVAELEQISPKALRAVETLLSHVPRTPFAIKDNDLRFVSANSAMLSLCGVSQRAAVIGKTARDFFPDPAWRLQENLDREVMRTRRPIVERLDLVIRLKNDPIWMVSGRWAFVDHSGEVAGVAIIGRILDDPDRGDVAYLRLAAVIEHLHVNFSRPIDVAEMARRADVSISQLERDFVRILGLSPKKYLTKIRFENAIEMLRADVPIAQIAHACGYPDQSAFTRRFRAAVGMSPLAYRRSKRRHHSPA